MLEARSCRLQRGEGCLIIDDHIFSTCVHGGYWVVLVKMTEEIRGLLSQG